MSTATREQQDEKVNSSSHINNDDYDNDDNDQLYESAIQALLKDHQATTTASIEASAARRTRTVQDMHEYLRRLKQADIDIGCVGTSSSKKKKSTIIIHIAGTKGKGSTAKMCQAILQASGYTTGLFTSPHLVCMRERIRIEGKCVSRETFGQLYWILRQALETYKQQQQQQQQDENDDDDALPVLPGYFRMLTLLALAIFSQYDNGKGVDAMIIEVGLGGRYDATNCLLYDNDGNNNCHNRKVCGVTLLDYDHTRILGNTLEEIAREKAGIFQPATTTSSATKDRKGEDGDEKNVLYVLDSPTYTESVRNVLRECARADGGGKVEFVRDYSSSRSSDDDDDDDDSSQRLLLLPANAPLGLPGRHQRGNAILALTLCRAAILQQQEREKEEETTDEQSSSGGTNGVGAWHQDLVLEAVRNVVWPGRCQMVEYKSSSSSSCCNETRMRFYLDGAHTVESVRAGVEWFQEQIKKPRANKQQRPILLFTCSHERNPVELLQLLVGSSSKTCGCCFQQVFFVQPDSSRPSSVKRPTKEQLLRGDAGNNDSLLNADAEQNDATNTATTWLETLQDMWKHLEKNQGEDSGLTALTLANVSVAEVLAILQETINSSSSSFELDIFVTGSLYLVGSVLKAINWTED